MISTYFEKINRMEVLRFRKELIHPDVPDLQVRMFLHPFHGTSHHSSLYHFSGRTSVDPGNLFLEGVLFVPLPFRYTFILPQKGGLSRKNST